MRTVTSPTSAPSPPASWCWSALLVLLGKRDTEARVCAGGVARRRERSTLRREPTCVEFSFKYGDDEEDDRGSVAGDAHDVLQVLSRELADGVHPTPVTKTALVDGSLNRTQVRPADVADRQALLEFASRGAGWLLLVLRPQPPVPGRRGRLGRKLCPSDG